MPINNFTQDDRFFIKSFLIDDSTTPFVVSVYAIHPDLVGSCSFNCSIVATEGHSFFEIINDFGRVVYENDLVKLVLALPIGAILSILVYFKSRSKISQSQKKKQ